MPRSEHGTRTVGTSTFTTCTRSGDTHIVALNANGYAALRTIEDGSSALVVVNLGTGPLDCLPEWIPLLTGLFCMVMQTSNRVDYKSRRAL